MCSFSCIDNMDDDADEIAIYFVFLNTPPLTESIFIKFAFESTLLCNISTVPLKYAL